MENIASKVQKLIPYIDKVDLSEKVQYSSFTVDWGRDRKQGKRIGGTVVGAMSDISGKRTYKVIVLPQMSEEDKSMLYSKRDKIRYLKAYHYGLSHLECLIYSLIF